MGLLNYLPSLRRLIICVCYVVSCVTGVGKCAFKKKLNINMYFSEFILGRIHQVNLHSPNELSSKAKKTSRVHTWL